MTLLASSDELRQRRDSLTGDLASLAMSLRNELAPVIHSLPDIPREKALLSRAGGRCAMDGTLLRFDPFDVRHVCPSCGRESVGGLHDRFRLYWYQLWLAERTVHAALLGILMDDPACTASAVTLLDRYADQYLRYPNADNVLGPSRPFFSTYLESIWLLQLTMALDLLESGSPSSEVASLGARVRDRLIAPSVSLIASYDEGASNRQVWNNAAMMAAAGLLDDRVLFARAVTGPSGLHSHLANALLSDGTWYEGENYHLFAHRGLWYGVQLAAAAGHVVPVALDARFQEGFAAPFRTLLPDLTYPSRRDSQHRVSVRQPRFAESCELGLARGDDERLGGMLARLYDPAVPRGETGRSASSADVERNLPATGLRRDDLSWRALLFARPVLPALVPVPFVSDLLPAQGLGILRRDGGDLYVSLDYGHSGGGHGHPDRLNLSLVHGDDRWFDDPGTGSYVDPTLHWFRSTLAHNAPVIDGHSQPRVHGELLMFDDDGQTGWVSAHAALAPELDVRRSIVVLEDYLVDEVTWNASAAHDVALPMHGVIPVGIGAAAAIHEPLAGGSDIEDGFDYLSGAVLFKDVATMPIMLRSASEGVEGAPLRGWSFVGRAASLWTARAPAPPTESGDRPLVLIRQLAREGRVLTVWTWRHTVQSAALDGETLVVAREGGAVDRHVHLSTGWNVVREREGRRLVSKLRGVPDRVVGIEPEPTSSIDRRVLPLPLPALLELGEGQYRRSEFTWQGAGAPRATVSITRPTPGTVQVDVDVPASQRLFVPLITENQLDNEPASINGDSVQLYAVAGTRSAALLLVPDGSGVDVRRVPGWTNDLAVDVRWRPLARGYHMEATLHIGAGMAEFALDVLVNDVVSGRARRRGQLVMSGANGEFVYLRGDRHDPSRLLRFSLTNV